jgi:hypothetical protein
MALRNLLRRRLIPEALYLKQVNILLLMVRNDTSGLLRMEDTLTMNVSKERNRSRKQKQYGKKFEIQTLSAEQKVPF